MAFEYRSEEKRKPPSEYGGSPYKALLAEISNFAKQHRTHSLRRYAGMDADEPQENNEGDPKTPGALSVSLGDCPECKTGTCEDPEHMSDEDKGGLEKLLGDEKRPDDRDY